MWEGVERARKMPFQLEDMQEMVQFHYIKQNNLMTGLWMEKVLAMCNLPKHLQYLPQLIYLQDTWSVYNLC